MTRLATRMPFGPLPTAQARAVAQSTRQRPPRPRGRRRARALGDWFACRPSTMGPPRPEHDGPAPPGRRSWTSSVTGASVQLASQLGERTLQRLACGIGLVRRAEHGLVEADRPVADQRRELRDGPDLDHRADRERTVADV